MRSLKHIWQYGKGAMPKSEVGDLAALDTSEESNIMWELTFLTKLYIKFGVWNAPVI